MNDNLEKAIGSGIMFPIQLTTSNGLVTCQPVSGDVDLIKQNLTSILVHQIGQRLRQENFGTRLNECIEEPNDQAMLFLIRRYIVDSISSWEPRLKRVSVETTQEREFIRIKLNYSVDQSQSAESLDFDYNNQTGEIYGSI